MAPMPALLTVDEVAKHLRITPRWVLQLLREGRLKGTQLAERGSWRISEDDLRDFIRSRGGQSAMTPVGELIFLYVTSGIERPEIEVRWHGRSFRLKDAEQLTGFIRSVGADGFTLQVKNAGFAVPPSECVHVGTEKLAKDIKKMIEDLPDPTPPRALTLFVHEQFPEVVADRIQRWQQETGHRPAW
jgi:excisionase family DNA binding protein